MKLSPITRRRLQAFKNNKRGYYSFWIFALLFCLTIPAEFIANDKPILISYKGGLYFPVLKAYPETTFDGYFLTETNYTDPYIIAKIKANGWIVNPLIQL
jgi:microcin C transport system permease protein